MFSDTLIIGIGNFITKFVYFFLMPVYTMTLTIEEFGIADLLNNSLFLLMPIFTLSITDAVFRFALDKETNFQLLLSNGLRILLYSFAVATILTLFVYCFFPYSYWWYFLVLYVVESTKNLFAQFTRGIGLVRVFALNGVLGAVFLLFSTYLFLVYFHLGVVGYLLAYIISNIVSVLYLLWKGELFYCLKSIDNIDSRLLKKMLVYSLPLIPNMLSWWLTNISSRYIIVGYCGLGVAGLFAAASKLPALVNILTSVFQQSWQFAAVKEYQEENQSLFYSRVFHYYSFLVIMFGTGMLVALPVISCFVLQGNFYSAWIYSPLLLFSAILGCYSVFFGTFYLVIKDNKRAMYSTFVGAFVNLIICFGIIPFCGVIGASIANVVSYLLILGIRIYDSQKIIMVSIEYKSLGISLALLLGQAVILTISFDGKMIVATLIMLLLILIHIKDFVGIMGFFKSIRSK